MESIVVSAGKEALSGRMQRPVSWREADACVTANWMERLPATFPDDAHGRIGSEINMSPDVRSDGHDRLADPPRPAGRELVATALLRRVLEIGGIGLDS
ncbi:MAG TPA: hypothetical protein PLE54_18895 [Burkholderiaceae bacterium]|nr:hypothetical protein [Burkholderiaceae bacterium]